MQPSILSSSVGTLSYSAPRLPFSLFTWRASAIPTNPLLPTHLHGSFIISPNRSLPLIALTTTKPSRLDSVATPSPLPIFFLLSIFSPSPFTPCPFRHPPNHLIIIPVFSPLLLAPSVTATTSAYASNSYRISLNAIHISPVGWHRHRLDQLGPPQGSRFDVLLRSVKGPWESTIPPLRQVLVPSWHRVTSLSVLVVPSPHLSSTFSPLSSFAIFT